jgi:V/A-type H+-transporting ATPase subunit I
MIVPMQKVYILSRQADRDRLLDALGALGVLHAVPVDAGRGADEQAVHDLDLLGQAERVLQGYPPQGPRPSLQPIEAAREVAEIQRASAEYQATLQSLHRQIEQTAIWGNTRLEHLHALHHAGLEVRFYLCPPEQVAQFQADLVTVLGQAVGDRRVVAVVDRPGKAQIPEQAVPLETPSRDRPTLLAEAARIDAELAKQAERLHRLAHLLPDLRREILSTADRVNRSTVEKGALVSSALFALQGWVPQRRSESLQSQLEARGISVAIRLSEPTEDDLPPTLVEYPRWARSIQALFGILGTVPGYREYDLGAFFMIALPIFAAMLFGDGGYGLIFLLVGLLGYRRVRASLGDAAANLIVIFGSATLLWGILTGTFFGVTPDVLIPQGGFLGAIGRAMAAVAVFWREDPQAGRDVIIKISFVLGTVHLVLAHVRQAIGLFPHSRFLAEIGWSALLVGMLGVVWVLFFPNTPKNPASVWMPAWIMQGLLLIGVAMVVGFSYSSPNPLKRLGIGLAANILPMIGTFSDTMSYIRLMAVGLASYYIAYAFNNLAWDIGSSSAWMILPAAVIIILAHALNIVLGLIAVFAHGVRLNMLEFSSNAGVQWAGYAYTPFVFKSHSKPTQGDR